MSLGKLPEKFRKLDLQQRQEQVRLTFNPEQEEWQAVAADSGLSDLADIMVESAIGSLPVPLGIATGFLIDGEKLSIPMAVEEPSVIAAASYAAKILNQGGGLSTWGGQSLMTAQIFLEGAAPEGEHQLRRREEQIGTLVDRIQPGMKARGGGFRGFELSRLPESDILVVGLRIDVRDAMGANALNTAAEGVKSEIESLSGGRAVMCILSNAARERRSGARFSLPVSKLSAAAAAGMEAEEVARRIVLASRIAEEDEQRAITHNKGIMNGISALVLATLNDTRAVEAAAHAWAARSGRYQPLSTYRLRGGSAESVGEQLLEGTIELPLAVGSLGGAVGFHPASRLALRVLGFPGAQRLARIAAAVGLAQNFAAVLALVTGGIQRGHMKYHAARLAYAAGARGKEVRRVAEAVANEGQYSPEAAAGILRRLRREGKA
ncbi:MAG: hydroxymethylglutaryl-CoA reductase, degradative [Spirochaetaceae bacterium]|nr:MAG: hydroxymethylglutaryl-CoA reductase, degradative [Spirochaetaceae bacterium]